MDYEQVARTLTPSISYSFYPIQFMSDPDKLKEAEDLLSGVQYDTMIGTGLSGALVVPMLAKHLGKDWGIVRKSEEASHRERWIEGTRMGKRWIFVDDFQQYGDTERRVVERVQEWSEYGQRATELVGCFFYHKLEWEIRPKHRLTLAEQVEEDLSRLHLTTDEVF